MLTIVHDPGSANDETPVHRSLLDEIVRDGARQMLAAALKAEVAAYVEQFADPVDENGRRLVVRSGYHHDPRGADRGGCGRRSPRHGSTTNVSTLIPLSGSGFPRRSSQFVEQARLQQAGGQR